MTLYSPDGAAKMTISATKNWNKLSVKQGLNRFIGFYDGVVHYSATGSNWYAASVIEGAYTHYRKAYFKNGNMFCFDFKCESDAAYGEVIEYIEDRFNLR